MPLISVFLYCKLNAILLLVEKHIHNHITVKVFVLLLLEG